MSDRNAVIAEFLQRNGWDPALRRPLAGDASFRKYDRLEGPQGRVVLMDAPPPQEDVRPFMRIARHLYQHGFSVPNVLAEDAAAGLLLLEDLGDDTYTRLLARGHDEHQLYALATDALIALHRLPADATPPEVPQFAMKQMLEGVNRLHTWYFPLMGTALHDDAIKSFEVIWRLLLPQAWKAPTALILADYHVDNLLLLSDRTGVKACGLLDFQDAVVGPVTYDLMSLLEDARRDIDPALVADMKQRYRAAFPNLSESDFELSWAIMAAQRQIRIIGTFARLKLRDNKPHYLKHMPRLWRYVDACTQHPALADLKAWLDRFVPLDLRAGAE